MKKIGNLLQKLKNITPPDLFIREGVSQALNSIIGLKISVRNISFDKKNGLVFIKTEGTKKTAIFLKKEKIIGKINKTLHNNLVKDIK